MTAGAACLEIIFDEKSDQGKNPAVNSSASSTESATKGRHSLLTRVILEPFYHPRRLQIKDVKTVGSCIVICLSLSWKS